MKEIEGLKADISGAHGRLDETKRARIEADQ
jgi:hypothetical protein